VINIQIRAFTSLTGFAKIRVARLMLSRSFRVITVGVRTIFLQTQPVCRIAIVDAQDIQVICVEVHRTACMGTSSRATILRPGRQQDSLPRALLQPLHNRSVLQVVCWSRCDFSRYYLSVHPPGSDCGSVYLYLPV
jgi:hypothetical protein